MSRPFLFVLDRELSYSLRLSMRPASLFAKQNRPEGKAVMIR